MGAPLSATRIADRSTTLIHTATRRRWTRELFAQPRYLDALLQCVGFAFSAELSAVDVDETETLFALANHTFAGVLLLY